MAFKTFHSVGNVWEWKIIPTDFHFIIFQRAQRAQAPSSPESMGEAKLKGSDSARNFYGEDRRIKSGWVKTVKLQIYYIHVNISRNMD